MSHLKTGSKSILQHELSAGEATALAQLVPWNALALDPSRLSSAKMCACGYCPEQPVSEAKGRQPKCPPAGMG